MQPVAPPHTSSLTRNQAAVYACLSAARAPMSAYQILASIKIDGAAYPATVYRALDQLVEAGLAHKVGTPAAFVACRHAHESAVCALGECDTCHSVLELDIPDIGAALAAKADARAFKLSAVRIEFVGRCADCAARAAS